MLNNEDGAEPSFSARMLACVLDAESQAAVRELAAARGWQGAEVIQGGIAEAHDRIEHGPAPKLLIVDIDTAEDPVASLCALAELCPADMSVIAIGTHNDLTLYRELLELGVTEYLTKPVTLETLERALKRTRPTPAAPAGGGDRAPAQLISFIGARGGVGTTTVAAGVAWCLANIHERAVAIVDLDLQFGNLALSLDLVPGPGLREAFESPSRIDGSFLDSAALASGERLRVLAAEEPLIDQFTIAPGAADAVLNVLRTDCDFIVADVPRYLDDVARRILTLSGTVGIVTDLSLASARDTMRLIELVKMMAPSAQRLVIGNHLGASHRGEVGKAEFERVIGNPIDLVIPFESTAALTTASTGHTLPAAMRNSKAAAAIRSLAVRVCGSKPAAKKARGTLLPSWLRRSA